MNAPTSKKKGAEKFSTQRRTATRWKIPSLAARKARAKACSLTLGRPFWTPRGSPSTPKRAGEEENIFKYPPARPANRIPRSPRRKYPQHIPSRDRTRPRSAPSCLAKLTGPGQRTAESAVLGRRVPVAGRYEIEMIRSSPDGQGERERERQGAQGNDIYHDYF